MNKLSDLAKRRAQALVRNLGFDLVRKRPNICEFLAARGVDVFLDVGANIGQTGLRLRQLGYRGKIVSFEPVRDAFRLLERQAQRDGNWQAFNFALGDERKTSIINVSHNSVFTSLLDQTPEARRYDTDANVARREPIDVERLDDFIAQYHNNKIFLKIVTQGYERTILAGARRSLEQIVGVELILPLVQLYENNWSLTEALCYMSEAGFTLAQIDTEIYGKADPTSLLEIYCVFRRDRT